MSMLAFFPWFSIEASASFGGFELIPYRRGFLPMGEDTPDQQVLDRVLLPYRETLARTVDRCTLLRSRGLQLTDDLSDDEIADAFACAEAVAFAALSARTFFNPIGAYANRDQFRLTVQAFSEPGGGVLISDTRRDGHHGVYFATDSVLVARPTHVVDGRRPKLDVDLLTALFVQKELPRWADYREAIVWFNSANTDSPDVLKETEHIFLVSAFERLLDLKSGKDDDLASSFVSLIAPSETIEPSACARIARPDVLARFASSKSLREVWIRDFYRLRGQFAHGRIAHGYPAVWTLAEHLLFASVAFPLMARVKLAGAASYALTENDNILLDSFEKLLCADHFAEPRHEDAAGQQESLWNDILNKTAWARAGARWVALASPSP